jgi:hypothetical protein
MTKAENLRNCEKCGNVLLESVTICSSCKKIHEQVNFKNNSRKGNSVGNILNYGQAVLHDDWIYFSDLGLDSLLQRIKYDGSQHEIINVKHPLFLNSLDDWIYYSSGNDQMRIFKIRPDGTERTQVSDDTSKTYNFLNIVDEWLYYISDVNAVQSICKMRLDGSERTVLFQSENEFINRMGVVGEWIFFSTLERKNRDNIKIYKIHNTIKKLFTSVYDSTGKFSLNNEWFFYEVKSQCIIKTPIKGSESTYFIGGYIGSIAASDEDGLVYYAKYSEKKVSSVFNSCTITDCAIYKNKPDGSEETRIIKAPAYNLLVVGDWILFNVVNAYEDEKLCMVRKDGTGRQFII